MPLPATITDPAHGQSIPTGRDLARVLASLHQQMGRDVLAQLRRRPEARPDLSHWLEMAVEASTRLLLPIFVQGQRIAERRIARLLGQQHTRGWDGARLIASWLHRKDVQHGFDVFRPEVLEAVRRAAFDFCAATFATSLDSVEEAQDFLRSDLGAGLARGESIQRLTERVQQTFHDPYRAATIAMSEASRASHAGQVMAARESNVVAGKRWLASSDACPGCLKLAAKGAVPLDEPFIIVGTGTYSRIDHPPLHPRCQCSLIDVLGPPTSAPVVKPEPSIVVPVEVIQPVSPEPALYPLVNVAGAIWDSKPESHELERARKVLGYEPTSEDIARLVGAEPNARLSLYAQGSDVLLVHVFGIDYQAERSYHLDPDTGERTIYNEKIRVSHPGRGLGADIFARQVQESARQGFHKIEALAAGRDLGDYNGYYTWPRLGYNAVIPDEYQSRLPPELSTAETLLDLYALPGGAEWWKANGNSIDVVFDLTPGSKSRRVLEAYLEARQKKRGKGLVTQKRMILPPQAEEIDLNPAEEEALRTAWERLRTEGF